MSDPKFCRFWVSIRASVAETSSNVATFLPNADSVSPHHLDLAMHAGDVLRECRGMRSAISVRSRWITPILLSTLSRADCDATFDSSDGSKPAIVSIWRGEGSDSSRLVNLLPKATILPSSEEIELRDSDVRPEILSILVSIRASVAETSSNVATFLPNADSVSPITSILLCMPVMFSVSVEGMRSAISVRSRWITPILLSTLSRADCDATFDSSDGSKPAIVLYLAWGRDSDSSRLVNLLPIATILPSSEEIELRDSDVRPEICRFWCP